MTPHQVSVEKMSLQSTCCQIKNESQSYTTDSHPGKETEKVNGHVIGVPSLLKWVFSRATIYLSNVKLVKPTDLASQKTIEPDNTDTNDPTDEVISVRKSKENNINDDMSKKEQSIENTIMKAKKDASQQKHNQMLFPFHMKQIVCISDKQLKNLIHTWLLIYLVKCAGATSEHCTLQNLKGPELIAKWKPTDEHNTDFIVNRKLIACCIRKFGEASLYPGVNNSTYNALIEKDGTCRVVFGRPSQTEMTVEIKSETGGLGRVHINGQLVRCTNTTMALANIKVETVDGLWWKIVLGTVIVLVVLVCGLLLGKYKPWLLLRNNNPETGRPNEMQTEHLNQAE